MTIGETTGKLAAECGEALEELDGRTTLSTERALEIADSQASRWRGTLARLADR